MIGLEDKLTFGKHKGKNLIDVISDNPGYVEWLIKDEIIELDEEAVEYLQHQDEHYEPWHHEIDYWADQ